LVGTYAFSYDAWDGLVFPPGLPKTRRLEHFARQFALVELDTTYYAIPREKTVERWAEQTPDGFTFTAKVPKQITQNLDGRDAAPDLQRFLGTMKLLGSRLGPVVFQMSPSFRYPQGLAALRQVLGGLTNVGGGGPRFAVEFRHASWLKDNTPAALLRDHNVGWVWNDWEPQYPGQAAMPRVIDAPVAFKVTADDFGYIRLTGKHGPDGPHSDHAGGRTLQPERLADLARWTQLAQDFSRGRPDRSVYVLISDGYAGSGPLAVQEIERRLGRPGPTLSLPRLVE
jgi:uncharacterized protein YecE (DUF72 family)